MHRHVLPEGFYWDDSLALGEETNAITQALWPNFLVEDSDLPGAALKFEISVEELARRMPNWGIRRTEDQKLVAYASAALIELDPSSESLPYTGWQFAMESAFARRTPKCVCLLVANVDPMFRGIGLASALLKFSKSKTKELGFDWLVGPVRPTNQHEFPSMTFEDYVALRTESGEFLDPWIRAHERCGAEVLNICKESVVIRASLARWQEWLGIPLTRSGPLVLPGGLAPLLVDVESRVGTYVEPNVWVRYRL